MSLPDVLLNPRHLSRLFLIAQLIGALIFALGFFPFNEPSDGYGPPLSTFDEIPQRLGFDRLVFVLIDALRRQVIELPKHLFLIANCSLYIKQNLVILCSANNQR